MALSYYVAHRSLSYADCYLAASAKFMNASPLWTFDEELAKRVPESKTSELMKNDRLLSAVLILGGAYRDRTDDLRLAKPALSQLS